VRYRWVVLGVGSAGAAAFATLRMGLPALGPALRDTYGLTLAQVGFAFTALAVGVMVTLVPWGMLTDRVGERWVLAGGLAGNAAALAATAFASGYGMLLTGLLAAGMLGASATGASGRAVMGWFARSERGLALGIRQMALPLGGALSSLALPHVIGVGGLRAGLLTLAGLSAVAAVAAAVWMREPPEPATPRFVPDGPPPIRDRRLWRLGAGSGLLVVAQSSLLGFVVLFLHDARGLSPALAAAGLAAIQLGGAAARLVAGRVSDLRDRRIQLIRVTALADAALLIAVAVLAGAPGWLLYPILLCAGIGSMTWNGLAFTAAAEISGRARAGTAMSLQNTIISVGSAAAPAAFGALVGVTSWPVAYAVLALAPLAGHLVLAPLVDEEDRRAEARARRLEPRSVRIAA
jgi:sugar phosphate permease